MKKICIISTIPTHPTNAGNRVRIKNLSDTYKEFGCDVHFIFLKTSNKFDHEAMESHWGPNLHLIEPLNNMPLKGYYPKIKNKIWVKLQSLFTNSINHHVDAWYPFKCHSKLKQKIEQINPDIIQVEYIFLSYIFKFFPEKLKVIDTHDIFANRNKKIVPSFWFSTSQKEENEALKRADFIISITDEENRCFKNQVNKHVITVGHIMPITVGKKSPKNVIGFIGADNAINIKTSKRLIEEFNGLPLPNKYSLLICGGIIRHLDLTSKEQDITLEEYVDLDDFYSRIQIAYNPTHQSTGLKIKNIEALAYNKILITTLDGAQGITDGINRYFYCIDESEGLSSVLRRVDYNIESYSYAQEKINEWINNLKIIIK